MKKQTTFFLFCIALIQFCCKHKPEKTILLSADREAPMGWVSLKIYEDETFEFISSGMRDDVIYPGTVTISNDTLYFEYYDKIPKAGKIAVIKDNFITYIGGTYKESLQIKSSNLKS